MLTSELIYINDFFNIKWYCDRYREIVWYFKAFFRKIRLWKQLYNLEPNSEIYRLISFSTDTTHGYLVSSHLFISYLEILFLLIKASKRIQGIMFQCNIYRKQLPFLNEKFFVNAFL